MRGQRGKLLNQKCLFPGGYGENRFLKLIKLIKCFFPGDSGEDCWIKLIKLIKCMFPRGSGEKNARSSWSNWSNGYTFTSLWGPLANLILGHPGGSWYTANRAPCPRPGHENQQKTKKTHGKIEKSMENSNLWWSVRCFFLVFLARGRPGTHKPAVAYMCSCNFCSRQLFQSFARCLARFWASCLATYLFFKKILKALKAFTWLYKYIYIYIYIYTHIMSFYMMFKQWFLTIIISDDLNRLARLCHP